ncbi:response regulator [Terrimonas sp. NA20]|uniref:Response regulator n=1 Tax=Terrimonas ginsenosidimutans TaxID=2908004 RepID=A0ABS9KKK3_9BACT|nr:response regulator [Terrimonas ginsenosidimutans]MCG2612843.1 response regulator [Terrimonas ginsenosidimutans]
MQSRPTITKTILVVDDDEGILDATSAILEYEGYLVHSTLDGASVLQLEGPLPDLLLLDIWMSGTDGTDVCRQLKSNADTRHLPVIMISASRDIEQYARDAGADDFLAKPYEMKELLEKVKRWL